MATITLRLGKGSPLTNSEVDDNFTNLNTELGTKANSSALASYLTTATAASTYLALAGGTMTGGVSFLGTVYNNVGGARFFAGSGGYTYMYTNTNGFIWRNQADTTTVATLTDAGAFNATGAITQNGSQVLHAGNYNSYSPTLTGTGASGTWGINITGNAATATSATDSTKLPLAGGTLTGKLTLDGRNEVYGVPTNAGTIAGFMGGTSGGTTAARTQSLNTQTLLNIAALGYTGSAWVGGAGLSFVATENQAAGTRGTKAVLSAITTGDSTATTMEFNGSALTINGSTAVTSSNYNTYAPTLTGTGASGTWGINITGNAGSATSATSATSANQLNSDTSSKASALQYWQLYGNTTLNPSGDWHWAIRMSHGDADTYYSATLAIPFGSDDLYFRRKTNGTNQSWISVLNSANYNSYSPTLTGTGASGTWGISITGNAATATTATNQSGGTVSATTGAFSGKVTMSNGGVGVATASTLNVSGDITSSRAANQGVLYLGTNGTSYLYADGSGNYILGTGSTTLSLNGNQVLTAGNYNSYSPTLTGTGASGTWGISISGNSATTSQRAFSGDISTTGQGRFTGWHAGGAATGVAVEVGVSSSEGYILTYNRNTSSYVILNIAASGANMQFNGSTINVTSGSLQQGGNQVLTAGNYTSYAPSTTGTTSATFITAGNATWGGRLQIGGNGGASSLATVSVVQATDGNLHMDPGLGKATYLNYYNNGIIYLNGSTYQISANGSNYNGNAATATSATSATSAGYLTGGDGGFYGLLYNALAGDLNTYNSPGLYSAEYTGSTNKPSVGANGHIIQISDAGGTDVKTQWFFPNGSSPYMRLMWGNTNWNPWLALLTSSNYNSYSPTLTGTGASGTWAINITGSAGSASSAGSATTSTETYRGIIQDTRAGLRSPNAYDDYRAHFEFTDQIVGGDWHTAFTMQGWHDAYSAWQIIGPASTTAHENFYLRSGVNTSWNSVRTILHSGNYNSYSPTLTGTGASGTWGISITGNAATVTNGLYKVGTNAIPAAVVLNTTADNWMWQWASSGSNDWYLGPTTANFGLGGSRLAFSSSGSSPAAELSIERGTTRLLEILQANLQYKSNVVLHAGNVGTYALPISGGTLTGALSATAGLRSYYSDHIAGDGYGIRFWESNAYKISMGVSSLYQYGTVTDYSIKMQMDNGSPGRGFTWGRESYAPVAALNATSGNFQTAGQVYVQGAQIASGALTVRAGGAAGVGWGTGLNIGDSSNYTSFIQDAGTSRWRNYGTSGYDWYSSGGSQIMVLSDAGNLTVSGNAVLTAGNYSSYAVPQSDVAGSGANKVLKTASNGYLYIDNWIRFDSGGIFSSTNSAHLTPNDNSYGAWKMIGTRNGWGGIYFSDASINLMMNANESGTYRPGYGWQINWYNGTLYVGKNANGGNTTTVLDASNYTSYSPSLGGSGASGTWGISITGNSATVGSKASSTFHQRAHFGTQNSQSSGYYKVRILPATSWMLSFTVRIYQGYQSYDIRISGYNYGGNYWYEPQASLMDSSATTIDVRFGYDSAYNLWVAFPASNYTGLDVLNVVNGYTQFDGNYADQFAIQYEASLSGSVQTTQTAYRPLKYNETAVSATSLQGYTPNQTGGAQTIVQRDNNGYIQNSYFYTSGGGSERGGSGQGYFAGFNTSDYYIRSYTAQAAASLLSGATMNIAGNAATASRATRANGNFYIDDNHGNGVVGVYSSYRYQTVYAMGDSYKMSADGTSLSNMYGMAWSHPNAGGAAGNLTDHGLLIINAGAFKCAISNSIVASANITAYSDERLKTNWRDMPENYVARLAQVKVGIYDRIDEEDVTQVGVSAQSFQRLLPQAIMTAKDEMQTLSVAYGNAALASAVELAKDNVELRARIERLESLINKLIGD